MANPLTAVKSIVRKVFGSRNDRVLKDIWSIVERINAFGPEISKLSDEKLAAKTEEFRDRFANGTSLDDLLPEAYAVCREASYRVLRTASGVPMRHFDVQLVGGIVLHQGKIAEMATGEGKTLVATLPSYLNAIPARGVHLITVNDYLAKRDRDWMAPLYESLGMTTGAIQSNMPPHERRELYECDVTYGTNNEFGFDYLRDNMKLSLRDQVQGRGRSYAIVDEVDSILVDEARTPLIISGPAEQSTDKYYLANRVAKRLTKGQDFELKEKERSVVFTEAGIEKAQKFVGVDNFYTGKNMEWPHLLEQSLKAQHLYNKDVEYVVRESEVVIVDEFTGRLMEGRTWSEGLHQAVEAKEGLQIRRENQTLATITLQNYFKLYSKLSGMTGTAMTEAVEFDRIYNLEVVVIPTNKPNQRIDESDVIYRTTREKYNAIAEEIVRVNTDGRPILVGTTSIERSELLSGMLKRRGIKHDVLNAKNHQREAEIVSGAGQPGRVTLSTNMAGRGTDIVLGPGVVEKGGLHVIGTERHEARRIDNQLRGRCARQGDPGSSIFFLSLEDDLMRRFAGDRVQAIFKRLGMKEGDEISHPWVTKAIARAQRKVEAYHFDIRKNLLEYDAVMNEQRGLVYSLRQEALEGEDLTAKVLEMAEYTIRNRAASYLKMDSVAADPETGEGGFDPIDALRDWARSSYGLELGEIAFDERRGAADLTETLTDRILKLYRERHKERTALNGEANMRRAERFILLMELDDKWKDHLHEMDRLRHAIGMRAYAQIDPKVAYKQEGYQMFREMIDNFRASVSSLLLRVQVREEDERQMESSSQLQDAEFHHDSYAPGTQPTSPMEQASQPQQQGPVQPIVNAQPKVGRNDDCPCGSGKKFKRCHGK